MCGILLLGTAKTAFASEVVSDADNFYKSDKVKIKKVEFKNQYNMKIVGNLFIPENMDMNTKNPAIIVGHPMGAVKEQSANLYAVKMAERGFVALSMDLSFWGESEGQVRNSVSPDIYAEAFSAAADYFGVQSFVDRDGIGVIGICGS
ncbi:MAG: alpha/beta hydrolase, partial [bacterium]